MTSASIRPLVLKCKFHTGQCILSNLTSESTVADLLTSISAAVNADRSKISLFFGYPPKALHFSDENLDQTLSQIPLISGDTLIVNVSNSAEYSSLGQSSVPVQNSILSVTPAVNEPLRTTKPHLLRLTAPSDNSCLFTSVLFCVNNADGHEPIGAQVVTNKAAVAQIRELIASIVASDPESYTEAFLGMANEVYCRLIQEPDRWGGGIEVAILSQLHELEICLVDIQSCRIDRFGEDKRYNQRIMLMYDGIHYDPMAMARPDINRLVTVFSTKNDEVLLEAQDLATQAREEWRFTDLATFTLICGQCEMPLTGQAGAQKHAKETGHTNFSEISNT
ncbi:Ubiquitin thioesterase OTU1 [Fasciola gigantica]|uniref:Ubiquitin thioesterase OTU n=1 Tax=Fasciola gigantica TaxID=46835 RepID=A0A504YTD7_FASGI|nr:Ubiquitin thioesterase OTU1 [Fasciola gigantica]